MGMKNDSRKNFILRWLVVLAALGAFAFVTVLHVG